MVATLVLGFILLSVGTAGNSAVHLPPDDPSKLVYSGTCDDGTTGTFQYVWPNGDVVKIVPKSGNVYWVGLEPDSDLVIGFFFQAVDAKDRDPISLTEENWIGKLKEESPNFYKRYKEQSNDCAPSPQAEPKFTGKDVFLKHKCDACHSVSSADVKGKKDKGPDLVNVTVRHKEDWLRTFIEKTAGHVSCSKVPKERDGKEHTAKFKGTKEEEDTLMKWFDAQRRDE